MHQIEGMESIDPDFSAMLSEMLIDKGLIKIPEGARYTAQDAIDVLLYASSSGNSIESAVSDLKQKNLGVPSADTIHNHIKANNTDGILSSFREINREFLSIVEIPDEPQDAAADFHDVGYYGDRDNVTGLNKNYSILLKVIGRVRSMVNLGTLFLDREFFNLSAISALHDLNADFIMAAKSNQRIDRLLRERIKKR